MPKNSLTNPKSKFLTLGLKKRFVCFLLCVREVKNSFSIFPVDLAKKLFLLCQQGPWFLESIIELKFKIRYKYGGSFDQIIYAKIEKIDGELCLKFKRGDICPASKIEKLERRNIINFLELHPAKINNFYWNWGIQRFMSTSRIRKKNKQILKKFVFEITCQINILKEYGLF